MFVKENPDRKKKSGIPQSVSDNQLEKKVVDIFIESDRCQYYFEWNRNLWSSWEEKDVLVWIINWKYCIIALRSKKKHKSIQKNAIGVPNANLFISENLTPVNSKLAFNCQKLKRNNEIEKSNTSMELFSSQKIIN